MPAILTVVKEAIMHSHRSHWPTVLAVVTIILGALVATFALLFGVGNLIKPDVPESALKENFRICVALSINALVLIYALIRPNPGGAVLCICAVGLSLVGVSGSIPLSIPFLVLGGLSIIRGRLTRRQETASL